MNKNISPEEVDAMLDEIIKKREVKDYGRAVRRLGGIMDLNQKEIAAVLEMTPQQLSKQLKKPDWTDEQKKRVTDAFKIPLSGLDYLASENDMLSFMITYNTQGDGGVIGQTSTSHNFHNTYNISSQDEKAEDILRNMAEITKNLAQLIVKLDGKI